jgi:hypothetical protein
MFRTFIFGILILFTTTLTGQEIKIPKIPVYGTPIVNSSQFQLPLYYVPHYIVYPAPYTSINRPTQQFYYYQRPLQNSIIRNNTPIVIPNCDCLYPPKVR